MSRFQFIDGDDGILYRQPIDDPRAEWKPTTEEEFEELSNPRALGPVLAEQAGIGAQRLAGQASIGIANLFNLNRPEGYAEDNLERATERGEFLSEQRPGSGIAQFAPDVALFAATGGGSLIMQGAARAARGVHSLNAARHIPVRSGMMSADDAARLGVNLTPAQRSLLSGRATAEQLGREQALATTPLIGRSLSSTMAKQADEFADVALTGTGLQGTRAVPFQRINVRINAVERELAEEGASVMLPTSNRALLSSLDDVPVHEQAIFRALAGDKVSVADVARVRAAESAGIISSDRGTRIAASLMDDVAAAAKTNPAVSQLMQKMDAMEVLRGIKYNSVRNADGMVDITRSVTTWRDRGFLDPNGMAAKSLNTMDYVQKPFKSMTGRAIRLSQGKVAKYGTLAGIGYAAAEHVKGEAVGAARNLLD